VVAALVIAAVILTVLGVGAWAYAARYNTRRDESLIGWLRDRLSAEVGC
jgi:hypothetical protein